MTETQLRFLRAIADRVSPEQVLEVHVFPPIKQGGVESGVAVVAIEGGVAAPASDVDVSPAAIVADGLADPAPDASSPASPASRISIFSASYRLTLKGADRGKWEADVVAEAEAPLDTVDRVVRGVQRRAGELADSERLTGEAFREAVHGTA